MPQKLWQTFPNCTLVFLIDFIKKIGDEVMMKNLKIWLDKVKNPLDVCDHDIFERKFKF